MNILKGVAWVLCVLVGAAAGLVGGALFGGNFATNFQLGDARGYEATGRVGLVLGAVQVPTDGQPLIFLADHPTTGGYPVIAVVDPDDLDSIAQARPGTSLRFRPM